MKKRTTMFFKQNLNDDVTILNRRNDEALVSADDARWRARCTEYLRHSVARKG